MQVGEQVADPASLAFSLRPWLALGFVLALLAATVWALRASAAGRRAGQGLAVESALSLGDKRSLVIVKVEGRRLLVGVAPGGVSLVTELHAPFGDALAQSLQKHEQPS
jgi:flagellar protein FliO/FliZ